MKKWWIFALIMTVVLSGCTGGEDKSVINGKEYTVADIESFVSDEGYQYKLKDKLLEFVVREYNSDITIDEEFNTYMDRVNSVGMKLDESDQKQIKEQMKFSKSLHMIYDKLIEVSDEEVSKELKDGYKQVVVEHAVILPTAHQEGKDVLETVRKGLQDAKTDDEYNKLREDWEEIAVDVQRSSMTKNTVIPGFEEVLDVKKGETIDFGQEEYRSVMKVIDSRLLTEEEIKQELRNAKILEKYSDSVTLLLDMDKVYDGLHFSEELQERLKKD